MNYRIPFIAPLLAALLLAAGLAAPKAQAQSWQQALAFNQLPEGISYAQATAANAAGDVFVVGGFEGQVRFGSTLLTTANSSYNVFVAKWSPSSGSWVWAASGTGNGTPTGIAVSGSSVYLTGKYYNNSSNGNGVQFGGVTLPGTSASSGYDGFVVKYTDNGASATCNWAVPIGGSGTDEATGVAVSGSTVYVAGSVQNNTSNANAVQCAGMTVYGATSTVSADALLVRFTDAGSSVSCNWARTGGGTGGDGANGVAVYGSSVYLTGDFTNTTTNANAVQFGGLPLNGLSANSNYNYDVFTVKYTDSGAWATCNWATAGGGGSYDQGNGIAANSSGVYVTGSFTNSSANGNAVTFGGVVLNGVSSSVYYADVFVVKYTDNGSSVTRSWAVAAGGLFDDESSAIAVSGSGVYVTGSVGNNTGNAGVVKFGSITVAGAAAGPDTQQTPFVAKYTDAGSSASVSWAVGGGGNSGNRSSGVAVSGSSVYAAMNTNDGYSTFGGTVVPERTAMLARLSASTSAWQAVATPQPNGSAEVRATATNAAGDVFVTGILRGQLTLGSTVLNTRGSRDMFLAKWNTTSSTWAWAVSGGGLRDDQGNGLAVSGTSVYVTGQCANTAADRQVARFGGFTMLGRDGSADGGEMFLTKYVDGGSSAACAWVVAGGGTATDGGTAVAVSGSALFVTGFFANSPSNFNDARFGGVVLNGYGSGFGFTDADVFVAKYTDAGSSASYGWAVAAGGNGMDQGNGIAVSGSAVYVTGTCYNNTANSNTVTFGGLPVSGASATASPDVFVARYTDNGSSSTYNWAATAGGTGPDQGAALALSGTSIYLAGSTTNTAANANAVKFGSTALPGQSSTSSPDVFVAKYTDNGASSSFRWTRGLGGSGDDRALALVASGAKIYLSGYLTNSSSNANSVWFGSAPLAGASATVSPDVFVARCTDAMTTVAYEWATVGGGSGTDRGNALALSGTKVFVGGLVTPSASFGSIGLLSPSGNGVGLLATLSDAAARGALATAGPLAGTAFALYPNPARTAATVAGLPAGAAVQVLDALGRPVAQAMADATGTARLALPTGLPAGVYVVRSGTQVQRLAVE